MSWDLVVFDVKDPPCDPSDGRAVFPDNWKPPNMGRLEEIQERISLVLPGVDWTEGSWGVLSGPNYSLEINVGQDGDRVTNFMIHARGNATDVVLTLMHDTGWRIFDTSSGKWMHLMDNPDEGRAKFQRYLEQVVPAEAPPRRQRGFLSRIFGWK